LTAHKPAIAYDVSTPVAPWHTRTCKALVCPQAVQVPLYTALAHTLQGSVLPNYAAPPTPLVQLCPSNRLDKPTGTIENA
jgi:hypothetical protein